MNLHPTTLFHTVLSSRILLEPLGHWVPSLSLTLVSCFFAGNPELQAGASGEVFILTSLGLAQPA